MPIEVCGTSSHQDHQDRSGLWCGVLDVVEMEPHAEHNYSKFSSIMNHIFSISTRHFLNAQVPSLGTCRVVSDRFFPSDTTR